MTAEATYSYLSVLHNLQGNFGLGQLHTRLAGVPCARGVQEESDQDDVSPRVAGLYLGARGEVPGRRRG